MSEADTKMSKFYYLNIGRFWRRAVRLLLAVLALGIWPTLALAHENYVLPQADIARGMHDWSLNVLTALNNPHNLEIGLLVGVGTIAAMAGYYFFMLSRAGKSFDRKLNKLEPLGHVLLRAALAVSLIYSALTGSFLGPELPLLSLPLGILLKPVLLILGTMLLAGWLTEWVGAVSLLLMLMATWVYKDYMLTYFNYFGEFAAFIFFGSRIFSVDRLRAKTSALLAKYRDWEVPLIRVTYGISILYPAISIKLLHPSIIVEIVNRYGLNQIHWLFPQDPLLIALGTGLAQVAVGLCIIFGFEVRLNAFVTLVLYVMSILFFKEVVWPHYILLALASYLVLNDGGGKSLDEWLQNRRRKQLGLPGQRQFFAGK